jgi:hypothetical protein
VHCIEKIQELDAHFLKLHLSLRQIRNTGKENRQLRRRSMR